MSDQDFQLGQAAVMRGDFAASTEHFSKALQSNPKDAQILACLGQSHCWLGQKEQGIHYLRQSGQYLIKKSKKNKDTQLVLGLVEQLQHWGDYVGATELCKQAVQINPQYPLGLQLLALCHSRLNNNKLAVQAAKQALKLVPDNAMLAILLATMKLNDGSLESARQRLEQVLTNPLLKSEERFRAHKELARVMDKLKRYDQVFPNLHAAGEVAPLLPEVKRQNRSLVPDMLAVHQQEFDAELLGRWAKHDFPAELPPPVFVLGFMRTGTTLTQEVLGAHAEVFVADETDLIMETVKELGRMFDGKGSIAQQLRQLDWDGALALRHFYWDRAKALFGEAINGKLFLDKTTMNSIDLGLIATLFPDAKLVFLLRDPRDVCLSCFMQTMIPTPSTVHLLTWEDTARFYAQIMHWWQSLKPKLSMAYTELRYEDAVFEFEPTFQRVFAFLGLDWDANVINFHKMQWDGILPALVLVKSHNLCMRLRWGDGDILSLSMLRLNLGCRRLLPSMGTLESNSSQTHRF